MSATVAWAMLFGVVLGVGLWSLVSVAPRLSRPSLAERTAPYLVDVSAGARQFLSKRSSDPLPVFGVLLTPMARVAIDILSGILGGTEQIERRLAQSRSELSVEHFRSQQLVYGVVGVVMGAVFVTVSLPTTTMPVVTQLAIPIVLGAVGVGVRDLVLRRAARRRMARIDSELPTVLEFLTLSLSAGETVLDGLRRVARVSNGELAREFAVVVTEVNSGVGLVSALESRAGSLAFPAFTRCVEQMTGALERGTPLSDVLRAQAQDSREDTKRALLEAAGKKEVTMLVPLVFLILPTTVLFAVWPGIVVLQTGF
ncbi:tight adherence protein C [Agreia bicolorata]|uniref:Pilus assembly protein n=1 Tax=Agreia bicolorata TaxID=110935 RepID=A0A1T4XC41_9MICO|nr:type II secretion system F family protein [Agreia bicolorata]KJC65894.1 pilus assembly protein [Agreia bicolorata]SKA87083.1 tight adherence protein C [Agreia bicolorata]